MSTIQSIEIGHGNYTEDWVGRSSVPGDGILFGCWCNSYFSDTSYPIDHGNSSIFGIKGSNWSILFIFDNLSVNSYHLATRYNVNAMVYGNPYFDGSGWANDYAIYVGYEEQNEIEALGWKWIGCQAVWGSSSLTLRIWGKFGLHGSMTKLAEQTISLATLRADLVTNAGWTTEAANAWTPSSFSGFQIGLATDGSGVANWYACYAKMFSQSSEPTLSELNAIAINFEADTSAWGDWPLNWVDGAVVLTDRSGNSRSLSTSGTLYSADSFDTEWSPLYGPVTGDVAASPYGFNAVTGSIAPAAGAAKRGSYGIRVSGSAITGYGQFNVSSLYNVYLGFWLRIPSDISLAQGSSISIATLVGDTAFVYLYLYRSATGSGAPDRLRLSVGGTNSYVEVTTATWYWINIRALVGVTSGGGALYIDGSLVASYFSRDWSAVTSITTIRVGSINSITTAGLDYDDIEVDYVYIEAPPMSPGIIKSIEFAHTQYGANYVERTGLPSGGLLFSCWSRVPTVSGYPKARGNCTYIGLDHISSGEDVTHDWSMVHQVSQGGINSEGGYAYFTSNSMLWGAGYRIGGSGTYSNDYNRYDSSGALSEAEFYGWTFLALQVIRSTSSFIFRHWLKFGRAGTLFKAAEQEATFASIRSDMISNGRPEAVVNAWTPNADMNHIELGFDSDENPSYYYLAHARIEAISSEPSLSTLDAIALASSADTGAYADWELKWSSGAADLSDRSGNSHPLSIGGGTLYEGLEFDGGVSSSASSIDISSAWNKINDGKIKIGGSWQQLDRILVASGGVWRDLT